jgi:uncharacterized membrane protein YkvA (DUF1232 family)
VTGNPWVDVIVGAGIALVVVWVVLATALALGRPRGRLLTESLRLLPDLLRLLRRLAADKTLPSSVRIRLALLLGYLAVPIDIIPDFIPVLGYADDAIIVTVTLRSVARRTGIDQLRAHWPGTEDGFAALCRVTGLPCPGQLQSPDR